MISKTLRSCFQVSRREQINLDINNSNNYCQELGLIHGDTITGTNDIQPSDVGCDLSATGYDKFYGIHLNAGQSASVGLEHIDPYNALRAMVMLADCPVRANSCIDDLEVEEYRQGFLTWTNEENEGQDYFIVVDAKYSYYGEGYDLSWSIY